MRVDQLGLVLDTSGRLAQPQEPVLELFSGNSVSVLNSRLNLSSQIDQALSSVSSLSFQATGASFARSAASRNSKDRKRKKRAPESPQEFNERVKRELDLVDIEEDITQMDLKTLRKHFGYKNGNIKLGIFCRNVVWQAWRFTQAGKPPAFVIKGGNVRSLRYYVKQITERHAKSFGRKTDFHALFGQALSAITAAGLLSYRDLNFIDTNRVNRWVAPSYGAKNVVVMAEKRAFSEELLRVGKKYGVTVQCTGGNASRVTVETMLLEMADSGHDLTEPFVVFAMVDFDPAGWNVADEFVEQMLELGLSKVKSFWPYGRRRPRQPWIDIVSVKELDTDFLDSQRHSLRVGKRAKKLADEWTRATGGLYGRGGKRWALSSEAFLGTLEEHLSSKLKKFLPKSYQYPKVEAFRSLSGPLKDYVTAKLFSQM